MVRLDGAPKDVWVGDVSVAGFASPFSGGKFAAMVVAFAAVPAVEKDRLARSLIRQGCRYAVCTGIECDDWETAFDDIDIGENPEGEASRFVMTTSHKAEPLEDVAEFMFTCTAIEDEAPDHFVVLVVGAGAIDQAAVNGKIARVLATLPNPPLQQT